MRPEGVITQVHELSWVFLIPLLPFIGAVINAFFGKQLQDKFGKKANHTIAIGVMAIAAILAIVIFFTQLWPLPAHERFLLDRVFPMVSIGGFHFDMAFAIDPLSMMMTLIITIIGTGIHIYSTGYMADEPAYWRFFCYLNLFVFSMLLLVLGDSFLIMFFGWEGVGLCSYLLIGFWYKEKKNATAGMKAFVANRVGDWGFCTGVFLLFWGLAGSWQPRLDNKYYGDLATASDGVGRGDMKLRSAKVEHVKVLAEVVGAEGEEHGKSEKAEGKEAGEGATGVTTTVNIGPTVSFRELRDAFALTQGGHRVLVEGGDLPVTVDTAGGKATVPAHFEGIANKTVWGIPLLFLVGLCLFIGACGKSAQIPLYVWLPDAMAGPTPVSALIHAATMVTAGVYMIARLNFVFVLSPGAMTIVAVVGASTALFAATIGLFQYDIKKVLAYSTVSQLGFMFIGVGVGAYWAGAFHLLTHACFKACLFLGSGSVIHGMHHLTHHREHAAHDAHGGDDHDAHGHDDHHEAPKRDLRLSYDPLDPQDMRNMGGLAKLMPTTRWTYLAACLAIAGFPIASGFYSKDEILWQAFANRSTLIPGVVIWFIGLVAATCTSFYMFRSYYMTFYFKAPSDEHKEHVHESPRNITWVLIFLAVASIVVGPLLGIPKLWFGSGPLLERWLEPVTQFANLSLTGARAPLEAHGLEWTFAAISVLVALAGWFLARTLYLDGEKTAARLAALKAEYAGIHSLVFDKYRVDELYDATVIRAFKMICEGCSWFDRVVVDGIVNFSGKIAYAIALIDGAIDKYLVDGAVNLVASGVIAGGREVRKVQTGRINQYLLGITAGVVVIVLVAYFA